MIQVIAGANGFVGKELSKLFPHSFEYDIKNPESDSIDVIPVDSFDVCHIAVPTPRNKDGSANLSAVEDVVRTIRADLYICHSTVPPGTIDSLEKKHKINMVMQPEYVASSSPYPAPLGDMRKMPFIILGGRSENTKKARRLYEKVYPPTVDIFEVDTKTAETIKYLENAFIATKVTFCNEAFQICKNLGVDYDAVRRGVFRCDPRMTEWWTYCEGKGWGGHCLPKDMASLVHWSKSKFFKDVIKHNDRHKQSANG